MRRVYAVVGRIFQFLVKKLGEEKKGSVRTLNQDVPYIDLSPKRNYQESSPVFSSEIELNSKKKLN